MTFNKRDRTIHKKLMSHFGTRDGSLGPYKIEHHSFTGWLVFLVVEGVNVILYSCFEWVKEGPWVEDIKERLSSLDQKRDLKNLEEIEESKRLYEKAAEIVRNSK